MPDTIFTPQDAFVQLLDVYHARRADLVIGLFPTDKPERFGMVDFADDGEMKYTVDKPRDSKLKYMWGIGCWGRVFTEYMNDYLDKIDSTQEIVLGSIFQAALEDKLNIRVVPFAQGGYIDIGSFDELGKMIKDNA